MSKIPFGIRNVKIENFRCIDKLELDFTDPQGNPSDIVVIAGPNGCGKTAVLEACYSLVQGNGPRIPEADPHAAERRLNVNSIRKGEDSFDISIQMLSPTGITVHQHQYDPLGFLPRGREGWNVCSIYVSSRRVQKLVGSLSVSLGKEGRPKHYPIIGVEEVDRLVAIKQSMLDMRAFELMGGNLNGNLVGYEQAIVPLNEMWRRFYPHLREHFIVAPASNKAGTVISPPPPAIESINPAAKAAKTKSTIVSGKNSITPHLPRASGGKPRRTPSPIRSARISSSSRSA